MTASPIPDNPDHTIHDGAAASPLPDDVERAILAHRSKALTVAGLERLLDPVRDAVRLARPVNATSARLMMSTLARFIADTAGPEDHDVASLLTFGAINKWVADGASRKVKRRTSSVQRNRLEQVRRGLAGLDPRVTNGRKSLPSVPPLPVETADLLGQMAIAAGGPELRAYAATFVAGVPAADMVGTRFERTIDGMVAVTANGERYPFVDGWSDLDVDGMVVVDGDWLELLHLAGSRRWYLTNVIARKTFEERAVLSGLPVAVLIPRYGLSVGAFDRAARWLPAVDIANDAMARRLLRG